MSEEKCEFEQIKKVREKDIQDFLIEKLNPDVVNDFMNLIYDYYTHFEQQLQTAKEENKKLNKLHAFLHNKFNWSKEDVWIRNYLSSYIFDEEMVSDGKEYISPLKQILDLTQQNKQMMENINNVKNLCNEDWEDMTVDKFQNQLLQALKEVNNEK